MSKTFKKNLHEGMPSTRVRTKNTRKNFDFSGRELWIDIMAYHDAGWKGVSLSLDLDGWLRQN